MDIIEQQQKTGNFIKNKKKKNQQNSTLATESIEQTTLDHKFRFLDGDIELQWYAEIFFH